MNETDGGDCPDWCRHHRVGRGGVVVHESRSQIVTAAIDSVPVDLSVSAARRADQRGVVLRIGDGWVVDLDAAQAKRLCTLITAAAALP